MNILSLFDGMSCGRIALKELGIEVNNYYASEIDPYAVKASTLNFPDIKHLGDVRDINVKDLGDIDLIIGGTPCTNFSFAGSQKGMVTKENIEVKTLEQYLELKEQGFEFEGQSYLFWEAVRLLKDLPSGTKFMFENVKMHKKWEDLITSTLGVAPVFINSSLVSAQSRKRLYWTNIGSITQPDDKNILLKDVLQPYEGRYVADTARNLRHEVDVNGKALCCTATMYKGAGNNGMSLIREDNGKLRCLTVDEVRLLQTVPSWYDFGDISKTQCYKMLGNGWTVSVVSHIFSYLPKEYFEINV